VTMFDHDELERLRQQHFNLSFCLNMLKANPKKFTPEKDLNNLKTLMNMAVQTLMYRITELEKLVDYKFQTQEP